MSNNERFKNLERFRKYQMYFEPVIIIDLDYKVIFKNSSAQHQRIKLQINNNIRRVLTAENISKLENTIKNETVSVIDIDIPAPYNRCIASIDETEKTDKDAWTICEKIVVLIFYNSINMAKNDADYTNHLLDLIETYNTHIMVLREVVNHGISELEDSINQDKNEEEIKKQLKFVSANHQKILRLQNRLNSYINNIKSSPEELEKRKTYCDISKFCTNLQQELTKYLQVNGYSIRANVEDEIFIVKLYEKDFLLLHLILITFILKYSETNTVNLKFFMSDENNDGIIHYNFPIRDIYRDKFSFENLSESEDIVDMDKLDLHLASIIASNNNSLIDIKTDSDKKNAMIDIIVLGKSPDSGTLKFRNIIANSFDFMSEQAQDMFAAEFSILGK